SETVKGPGDFVARYGGEEFVVILPNMDRQGAIAVAERIRQAIQLLAIPHERSEVSSVVSVSMGVVCVIPTTDSSPETLISMADQAMYKAKQQGRNLAIVYTT
ncbi:MAG: diguanylate cyclase, partial [Okeania sp. SIO2D1]|nr:diguanylate cyclase [Okeania sp. SIO2D1]